MATVGSDYSAHRRSIDELEKDYETQKKKAKERETARDARLERSYQSATKKIQKENEHSLENIRDEFESSAKSRTEIEKSERTKLEKQLYDRSGRSASAASAAAEDQRDAAIQNAAGEKEKYSAMNDDVEKYYAERSQENAKEMHEEVEAVADRYRKQLAEARSSGSDSNEKFNDYREKLQKESQNAISEAQQQVNDARRKNHQLVNEYETQIDRREKKNETSLSHALQTKDQAVREKLDKTALSERMSRERENTQLRDQVKDVSQLKKEALQEKNRGRADAIREYESDWTAQMKNQEASHGVELAKIKGENKHIEKYLERSFQEVARDKDQRIAQMIRSQNDENAHNLATTSKEYDRSLAHVKMQGVRDKEMSQTRIENQRNDLLEDRTKALEGQAKIYQKTLSDQRSADQGQIKNLERLLNDVSTTEDPGRISSAAEAAVRKQMETKYEKSFQADVERNARARDHLQDGFRADLHDAKSDNTSQAANLTRTSMLEQQQMKDTFNSHIQDVEQNKQQMMQLAEQRNDKTRDAMSRVNERSTNELRRHYEELISTQDVEHQVRYRTLLQETDFEKKSIRRDNAMKTSDMIREYEKKLADQKLSYDEQLRDLKARTDAEGRDSERTLKQALTDQARSYQHQLAEMESQIKERQHISEQNHEDELEKVKRANALLLSKKG